ncbi:MAG: hypothetical protein ABIP48_18985 [Planctomycetota bacterium]
MSLSRIFLGKAFGAVLLAGISNVCASGGTIDTVAGTGLPENIGDTLNHRVRRVRP